MFAISADEPGLCLPVRLGHVVALGALPGRVSRVDDPPLDSGHDRLVDDKRPELPKRPGAESRPLGLSKPFPGAVPDPREVLEGDPASGALGLPNELFGNSVVLVVSESGFLAGVFFELPADVLGSFPLLELFGFLALERSAKGSISLPAGVDLGPGVPFSVRVGRPG